MIIALKLSSHLLKKMENIWGIVSIKRNKASKLWKYYYSLFVPPENNFNKKILIMVKMVQLSSHVFIQH